MRQRRTLPSSNVELLNGKISALQTRIEQLEKELVESKAKKQPSLEDLARTAAVPRAMTRVWYCYLLECADGTLYTGITNDLKRRLAAHNAGRGASYTRGRRPVLLLLSEMLPDRAAALRREAAIKRLPRSRKLQLARAAQQ